MRGHITKRSKGSWSIVLDQGKDPTTGKRRQQWISVKGTKKDAERRLTELLGQVDTGVPIDNSRLGLGDYLETWLRDVVAARTRPRTADSYAAIVKRHILPALGTIHLSKLHPGDVERMEASLLAVGLTANTVKHVHVVLSKALKDAMRKGLVHRNVCQAVETPRIGRYEVKIPDARGIGRILDMACIALDASTIEVLREHRGHQLLRQIELEGAYQDKGLVFPGPLGETLDPGVVTHNWIKLTRKIGYLGLRLHDLRHAHAGGLIRAGVHPSVVQERLGHSSAAFTMQVYGHVAAGLQTEAATAFANVMKNPVG